LSALSSCAVNPPGFVSTSHRLILLASDSTGQREERLSFFASIRDQDGVGDIDYLYVMHDESELFWTLTVDNWIQKDEGDSVWLGSNGLEPGDVGLMPRGRYRAVVVDKAGERDERIFNLSAPVSKDYALPAIRLVGNQLTLDSPYQVNNLFFLDPADNPVKTVGINPGTSTLDTLWGDSSWRTAAYTIRAYGFDLKAETGFFSWKIRLND
ncbi:MAG: hypothetical protein ABIJ86_02425, partial [Spirochaetota bacterium]